MSNQIDTKEDVAVEKKTSTAKKTTSRKKTETTKSDNKTDVKKVIPKDVDLSQYVTVKNGFQGKLVYRSKHTGELFVWDSFGDEQEMELRELKNAKNSSKAFFENNWFMFEEDWIVDFLGVRRFYKNAISVEGFDDIFNQSADEIKSTITGMTVGQRKSAAYRARQLIAEEAIDSLKVISALEESLGIELIEK